MVKLVLEATLCIEIQDEEFATLPELLSTNKLAALKFESLKLVEASDTTKLGQAPIGFKIPVDSWKDIVNGESVIPASTPENPRIPIPDAATTEPTHVALVARHERRNTIDNPLSTWGVPLSRNFNLEYLGSHTNKSEISTGIPEDKYAVRRCKTLRDAPIATRTRSLKMSKEPIPCGGAQPPSTRQDVDMTGPGVTNAGGTSQRKRQKRGRAEEKKENKRAKREMNATGNHRLMKHSAYFPEFNRDVTSKCTVIWFDTMSSF